MASTVVLWLVSYADEIGSILKEAGYNIHFIGSQVVSLEAKELTNWRLLFIDMEVIHQTDEIIRFLERLRRLNRCKVVVLCKPEFYPLIQQGEFKAEHLINHIIFFPLAAEELVGNAWRYLEG